MIVFLDSRFLLDVVIDLSDFACESNVILLVC